jgi:hypothetical protein
MDIVVMGPVVIDLLAAPAASPGQWPERLALTLGTLAVFGAGTFGMWRSWRRRSVAQADLLPLPEPPDAPGEPVAPPAEGLYVGTTLGGDWQARVVAGDLSHRSRGSLTVYPGSVSIDRPGPGPLTIPAAALRDVRTDRAHAGKVLGPGGMLVLTWEQRGTMLDTGFAPDDRGQQDACLTALRALVPAHITDSVHTENSVQIQNKGGRAE